MQLLLCSLFAWLSISLFSLMPKRLSFLDIIFLYSLTFTMTTIVYTLLDVNIHFVTIPRTPILSFSTIITRVVTIPLVLIVAVDFMVSSKGRKPHWFATISIWLGITVFDWLLDFIGVITYQGPFGWHVVATLFTYLVFIGLAWRCTCWYTRLDDKHLKQA